MRQSSAYRSRRQTLLAALRALPADPDAARRAIGAVGTSNEAWLEFVDDAAAHGVLGVIGPALPRAALPPAVVQAIERRRAIEAMWRDLVVATLDSAASAIAAAGIRVCALKGPALAQRLYDPPGARTSLDIDLLVSPDDLERASAALASAGYAGDTGAQASYLREHSHHLHFTKPRAAALELHFRAYAGFGTVLPASSLLDRAEPLRIGGTTVLVPSPEDEILYLAAHAAGHSFIRLVWLYDLKLLLARHPAVEWNAVWTRAEAAGLATALRYTLTLLERWLGVQVPFAPRTKARSLRWRAATLLLDEVSRPSQPSARDVLGGLIFTALLCDRTTATAWLIRHHMWRMTRRRLHRLAPRTLPPAWAG